MILWNETCTFRVFNVYGDGNWDEVEVFVMDLEAIRFCRKTSGEISKSHAEEIAREWAQNKDKRI